MKATIKEQNYWLLHDIALRGINSRKEAQGTKLQAIYKLIQKRGEPIESEDDKLNGVKALQYGEGQYIAMKKTSIKSGSFYPCAIQTISLTIL